MILNSSSTNTVSSTNTDDVYEKPVDTIEKYFPNNWKDNQNSIAYVNVYYDAKSFETPRKKSRCHFTRQPSI